MFIPSGPSAWPIAGPGRAEQDGTLSRTVLTRAIVVGWFVCEVGVGLFVLLGLRLCGRSSLKVLCRECRSREEDEKVVKRRDRGKIPSK